MIKLTKKEFFDIYGISLLLNKIDDSILLKSLLPIAHKYYDITSFAVRSELRYFKRGGFNGDDWGDGIPYKKWNIKVLKKLNIRNWKVVRTRLNLKTCLKLFKEGEWEENFGGTAWEFICEDCIKLEKLIKTEDLRNLLITLDHLNQLEHNNALYLTNYTTFDLQDALCLKFEAIQVEDIISQCSDNIKRLYNKSNSLVYKFHCRMEDKNEKGI